MERSGHQLWSTVRISPENSSAYFRGRLKSDTSSAPPARSHQSPEGVNDLLDRRVMAFQTAFQFQQLARNCYWY